MSTTIKYFSQPLRWVWKDMYQQQKKITPDYPDGLIYHVVKRQLLYSPIQEPETSQIRSTYLALWDLWYQDCKREVLHIFMMDLHLVDFLASTPIPDMGAIAKFLKENGSTKELVYAQLNQKTQCIVYAFCLHLPNTDLAYAYQLSLMEDGQIELYFLKGNQHGFFKDTFYNQLKDSTMEQDLEYCQIFRLALNTIAYMHCFPDCVKAGPPDIKLIQQQNFNKPSVVFTIAPDILEDKFRTKGTRRPHFRKGHFRFLQSPYFTHKQGQVVFVRSSMVQAPAKTVFPAHRLDDFK